jgi:endonuclease/exonuclease/phosphatase family metal-dependent hydrolase
MIAIISFNILTREYFKSNEIISNEYRKRYIFYLINKWASSELKPIIALQEVTGEWKDDIDKILIHNEYKNISINYGYIGNGDFGILSAVPKHYEILDINYINIGNIIKSENNLVEEELVNNIIKPSKFIIELTLKYKKTFKFYNYHLPIPKLNNLNQLIHTITIKNIMCKNNKLPIIWAGDFNITPFSNIYNFIEKNTLISNIKNIKLPSCYLNFQSSYKSFHGSEPLFTTHTKYFRNTLDYIFITNHFKCIYSKILQFNHHIMPNKYNPSDHLPIISFLEFN